MTTGTASFRQCHWASVSLYIQCYSSNQKPSLQVWSRKKNSPPENKYISKIIAKTGTKFSKPKYRVFPLIRAILKTLCRPECFASVCFCFDSVAEGKPFEKRTVLVHFAA